MTDVYGICIDRREKRAKIDLPEIKIKKQGKAPDIAKMYRFDPLILYMDSGEIKKGTLCIIHQYPKASEGRRSVPSYPCVFAAEKDANADTPLFSKTYSRHLSGDAVYTLTTAEITGNAKDGFTICLSPESKPFERSD